MVQVEKVELRKAYVELNEIIKALSEEEQEKIPEIVKKNIKANMDKGYKFILDKESDILNQNYRIETKALFVELYERYLAPEEERDFWTKYDEICYKMIEDEKRKKYNPDNIFKNKEEVKSEEQADKKNLPVVQEEKWYKKIFDLIKRIFNTTKF